MQCTANTSITAIVVGSSFMGRSKALSKAIYIQEILPAAQPYIEANEELNLPCTKQ